MVVAEGLLALPVLEVVLHIVELGAEETPVVAVAVFAVLIPLILGARQEVEIARRGLVDALASALIGALLALEVFRQEIVFVALDTLLLTRWRHLGSAAVLRPDVHDAATCRSGPGCRSHRTPCTRASRGCVSCNEVPSRRQRTCRPFLRWCGDDTRSCAPSKCQRCRCSRTRLSAASHLVHCWSLHP